MRIKETFESCFTLRTGTLVVGYFGVIQSALFTLAALVAFVYTSQLMNFKFEGEMEDYADKIDHSNDYNDTMTNKTKQVEAEMKDLLDVFFSLIFRRIIRIAVLICSISVVYFMKNLITYLSLISGVYKKKLYDVKKWIIYNLIYLGLQLVMDIDIWKITSHHAEAALEKAEFIMSLTLLVWNVSAWILVLVYYYLEKRKNNECFRGQELSDSQLVLVEADDELRS